MDLHDTEAAHALQFLGQDTQSQVPETQLSTQQIMAEIQFCGGSGAGAVLPTRPRVRSTNCAYGKIRRGMV